VASLAGEVKTLRWLLPLVTGVGIAVVAALVALKA
jgi:hypothetical protein